MLLKMFFIFFKIGAFTIGGGYAMIPIIQEEIVNKHKWMEEDKFIDALGVSQASPGPIAVNTSIYVGYELRGFSGALIATLGTVLPSFLIIVIVSYFFELIRDNIIVTKMFKGIGPVVVALIASAVYKLLKTTGINIKSVSLMVLTAVLIVFFNISPIYIILVGGIGYIILKKTILKDVN